MAPLNNSKYWVTNIPCKPYLRKYIGTLYGLPFKADKTTVVGHFIIISLEKKSYDHRLLRGIGFEHLKSMLPIALNEWFFLKIGYDMPIHNVCLINSLIEERFIEDLYCWCKHNLNNNAYRYKGYDNALRSFAERYNIILDEDITFDGLKRKELRYRRKIERSTGFSVS